MERISSTDASGSPSLARIDGCFFEIQYSAARPVTAAAPVYMMDGERLGIARFAPRLPSALTEASCEVVKVKGNSGRVAVAAARCPFGNETRTSSIDGVCPMKSSFQS
eukprot:scaffold7367_cov270-Pinguiococcus_pyrenoidosus.AAC.1